MNGRVTIPSLFSSFIGLVISFTICLTISGCGQGNSGPSPQDLIRRQRQQEREKLSQPKTLEERLAKVEDYLANGNTEAARKEIRPLLITDPQNHDVIFLSAKCEARSGDAIAAAEILESIDEEDVEAHNEALWLAASWLIDAHQYDAAQAKLQRMLELPGDNTRVHRQLAVILNNQGRRIEAAIHLKALARSGDIREKELFAMNNYSDSFIDESMPNPDFGEKLIPAALVAAKSFRTEGELQRARILVDRLSEAFPQSTQISAFRGRVYADLQDEDLLRNWLTMIPDGIEREPEYWHTLGIWLQRQDRHREAVRCFAEAVTRDQTDRISYLALARSLEFVGEHEAAQQAATRFELLNEIAGIAKKIGVAPGTESELNRMADVLEQLQRPWEAISWRTIAMKMYGDTEDARAALQKQRDQIVAEEESAAPSNFLLCGLELKDWPLPKGDAISQSIAKQGNLDAQQSAASQKALLADPGGEIYFQDQAKQRGFIHTCEIAAEASSEGHNIFQTVGGGVAVIDFDLDGWPDLAAAMMDGKPMESDSLPNRLFRNLDGKFADVTTATRYNDKGFAQGITVGDFNDDGFPDIFDANIGHNRLYRNQGDGTFQETAMQSGPIDERWTTSAVIVDIDGDGNADLYEAAYCSGREPYTKKCHNRSGISACMPTDFPAQQDRVWRGAGDGTFVDATSDWMEQTSPGRGLGVLAGQFDERPGMDLYVANDMTVNHLWSRNLEDGHFRLTDLAAVRGVGFSGRSISQASMGMTAGDPDGDGDIDFFLTHFSDDHNTYYEQVAPGLWSDRTFPVGLAEPSMKMLGFGTEWVDFDNNGTLELIVTNGHVSDVDAIDTAYRMPPQLFRLDASGKWGEQNRDALGDYFTHSYLGRALATLDADRDGRVDVAITHLYDPVALLINQTGGSGKAITLELKSTRGQRDAIGATVTMTVGDRTVTSQLTAGDGYMCSNQRRITVGTGNISEVADVTVTWPSGSKEEFGTLASGHDHLLLEGSAEAYQWQVKP